MKTTNPSTRSAWLYCSLLNASKKIQRKRLHEHFIQNGKTTAIRRIAAWETIASLGIMWAQLKASLKPLRPLQHYRFEVIKGVLNLASIIPRDVRLLHSRCNFFSSLAIGIFFISQPRSWHLSAYWGTVRRPLSNPSVQYCRDFSKDFWEVFNHAEKRKYLVADLRLIVVEFMSVELRV